MHHMGLRNEVRMRNTIPNTKLMEGIENEFSRLVNDCFRCADQGNKGFLTKEDYKVSIIQLFGYKPSKHEVSNIWSETVSTDEEGLALNKFMNIVLPRLSRRDSSDHIRQVFLAFDRFCHGFISQDDCIAAFVKV